MTFHIKKYALASLAAAALAACGGGDENGQNPGNVTTPTLSGLATKGPLLGATVSAYEVINGTRSIASIGTTTTSTEDGTFQLVLTKSTKNPICLDVTAQKGSRMISDTDPNETIQLTEDLTLSSCAPANATTIGINPYTNLVAKSLSNSTITNDSIENANEAVALIAGFNPLNEYRNTLPPKLDAIYGDGKFSCGDNGKELCGIVNLNNDYAQAITAYTTNEDKQALKFALENATSAPVKPETNSPLWNSFFGETTPPVDGGNPPVDGGNPPVDGGNPPVDGGNPPIQSNDPRYGNGGQVLPSINVLAEEVEQAPNGYQVTPAGFFVFSVSDLHGFAMGQYITAAKVATSNNDFGYAFGSNLFSASTKNGWATSDWSYKNFDNHYGRAFLNGQLLTTCQRSPTQTKSAGSDKQIIAFSEKAEVVTDATELYGKMFTEYSCGVDDDNWFDYSNSNKTPLDYTTSLFISQTGLVENEIPVSQFIAGELIDGNDGWKAYATAYKLDGKYFIIMKDHDSSREENDSQYGLTLAVSN